MTTTSTSASASASTSTSASASASASASTVPLDEYGQTWTVTGLSLPEYFEVPHEDAAYEDEVLGIEAWIMTGDHAGFRDYDNIPDRCEEVLDGLLDSSTRQRWGLTEEQAQVFEVTLRGMHSVRPEYDYWKSMTAICSGDWHDAIEDSSNEIIAAQREGPVATQRCLEKYRNKRFYTREDEIHCFYKFDENNIWKRGELMEEKYGPNPSISPETLMNYKKGQKFCCLRQFGLIR
jgi:hypothetical protein